MREVERAVEQGGLDVADAIVSAEDDVLVARLLPVARELPRLPSDMLWYICLGTADCGHCDEHG